MLFWFLQNQLVLFYRNSCRHTPDDKRIQITSFYLDGKALCWYQSKCSATNPGKGFYELLRQGLVHLELDDYQGQLSKLCQTSSAIEYQQQFEALSNRVHHLLDSRLLSCFMSGIQTSNRNWAFFFSTYKFVQSRCPCLNSRSFSYIVLSLSIPVAKPNLVLLYTLLLAHQKRFFLPPIFH